MKKKLFLFFLCSISIAAAMNKSGKDIESLETPLTPPPTPIALDPIEIEPSVDSEELSEFAIRTYREMMRFMTLQEEVLNKIKPHLAKIIRESQEHQEGVRTLRRIQSGVLDVSAHSENREMQFIRDMILAADHLALADQHQQLSNSVPRVVTARYSAAAGLFGTLLTSIIAIVIHFTQGF